MHTHLFQASTCAGSFIIHPIRKGINGFLNNHENRVDFYTNSNAFQFNIQGILK